MSASPTNASTTTTPPATVSSTNSDDVHPFDEEFSKSILQERKELFELFAKLNIQVSVQWHGIAKTVADLDRENEGHNGHSCKNLFIRAKIKGTMCLIVMLSASTFSLKDFDRQMELTKKDQFRFASEELLMEHLHLTQGCVNPFAFKNVKDNQVQLFLEKKMLDSTDKPLFFHPMTNNCTVGISSADLEKFFSHYNIKYTTF